MRMIGEMRRLICLLTAAVFVAAPLATAGAAMGEQHREHSAPRGEGRGEPGRWMGGGRGAPAPQPYRGGGEFRGEGRLDPRADPRFDPRGDPRFDPRGDPRYEYRGEQRVDPRYDPRGYAPAPNAYGAPPRRGGYLAPDSDRGPVQDYARQHLRPPPRGYEWVRTPSGMALVSQSTHQVFDVVPY